MSILNINTSDIDVTFYHVSRFVPKGYLGNLVGINVLRDIFRCSRYVSKDVTTILLKHYLGKDHENYESIHVLIEYLPNSFNVRKSTISLKTNRFELIIMAIWSKEDGRTFSRDIYNLRLKIYNYNFMNKGQEIIKDIRNTLLEKVWISP